MSPSIEDLVRAAQQDQAERTVDPHRTLSALPQRRVRVVRRRRLALALAAAAVAAVAAVPVLVLRPGPAPQPPSATPTPTASAPGSEALRFSPGWLPAGYAEYSRTIVPSAGITRTWGSAAPKSALRADDIPDRLSMNVVAIEDLEVTRDETDEPVDINGSSGGYRTEGPPAVYWAVGGFTIEFSTIEAGLSKDTMLRIARSVRPDPTGTGIPFTVALPAGQAVAARSVTGVSPGQWLAMTDLGEDVPGGDVPATGTSIKVGTVSPAPAGGTALQVAGHPARYLYSEVPEAGNYLVVELGGGLLLTVYSMDLDRPAIVALAGAAGPPDPLALTWIGS